METEANKMIKQPSYRFAGYTEPWEEKKLGEVAEIYDGTHQTPIYTTEGVVFLSVENIRTLHSDKYISKDAFDKDFRISPKSGDVLMTRIGDIGTSNLVETDIDLAYYVSLALIRSSVIESKFLNVSISSDYFQKELWKRTLHIAFPKKINKNEIGQSKFFFPSLPEQTAIGSFFQDIDQLISLQQRKLEVLKEQKKTYLKLLFPAKGQTKPALRFAGFEDEWKEVKLGEVTYIKTGGRDVQDSVEDGLYPFYIRSEEVKRINSYSFDGEAILIPGEGRLGEIFHYANGKFDVHQRVYKISNFTDVNAKFVLQQMKKDFKQHAMRNTVKATVDSLRLPTIQSFNILVPSLPEQTAIGSFFQDLDKAIAKQEEKVNQLKESKQTLLRKMFI